MAIRWRSSPLLEEDKVAGPAEDILQVGRHRFRSRLVLGTGKYATFDLMRDCLAESGTEMVTVAVRRVDLSGDPKKNLLNFIDRSHYQLLPNTAGCYTAEDAIRTAQLARELGIADLVKLEVLGDPKTLLPDPMATLKATEAL